MLLLSMKGGHMTEAQKKATAKYDKNNTRIYSLKLNTNTDKEIIEVLDSTGNVQGFIKGLIREYIQDTKFNA